MTQAKALRAPGPTPAAPIDAADPTALVQYAISRGVTPGELKDLMDLADKERARIAAAKFGEALASFQADCPQIDKTREVRKDNGELLYYFAPLEDIEREIQPVKARYGLSTSGTIKNTATGIEVAWVLQVGSHRETREYVLPPMGAAGLLKGGANATQNLGAWMTYIRRYTYCMALGVTVRNEDTDANTIRDVLLLTDDQRAQVDDWIKTGIVKGDGSLHRLTEGGLLKWLQGDLPEPDRHLDRLTQEQFKKVVTTFRVQEKKKAAQAGNGGTP